MTLSSVTSPPTTRRGIAVLGGSFDPPHLAHRKLATAALERLPVQEVRVLPAGDHPHKRARSMNAAADRLAMCRLAFAGMSGVVVDDRELRRRGPSFTVDTLAELAAEHPGAPLYFVIGSDNLPLLPTWRDHHRILALAKVVTYPRHGHEVTARALEELDLTADERRSLLAHVLPLAPDAIAATDVRRRWRAGERDLAELDPTVRDYIAAHGLYAQGA